jgi:CxxC motif-containing protein (DUF1111 family)
MQRCSDITIHGSAGNGLPHRGFVTVLTFLLVTAASAQVGTSPTNSGVSDPGVRGGPAGAGKPFANGLTLGDLAFFNLSVATFNEVEDVSDGLGPRFNLDSCAGCHISPATGGSSPLLNNPQVARLSSMAPGNTPPAFLKSDGPVREVRFVKNPDGTPDGGVHGIFTICGRADKPAGCSIAQPDFSNTGNMVFRIPTPVFGAGLIESITDGTIRSNIASDPFGLKRLAGITGHVNTNGNDGTVTRFGWKAQNKSLLIFSGEAYNVEMGVTNEAFPNEREEDSKCATNGLSESHTGFDTLNSPSDMMLFTGFMRFLDQPKPACGVSGQPACSSSVNNGKNLFTLIGCALCHTPTLTTGASSVAALSHQAANLFSDLAVHNMGSGLADGVSQGGAGPDEFRTAPLWGVGQRAFFLHDGRTKDLLQAILAHESPGSEGSRVVDVFQLLRSSDKQDILNFLRSL